jgi:hypothetical protein
VAFRSRQLRSGASSAELELMARVNVAEALGVELPPSFALPLEAPAIPDGRMHPHEWIVRPGASWLKVDGVDHGDDHLFPGPTDAAWDLAGAAVEWELDAGGVEALLDGYRRQTRDDARSRFGSYVVAYAAFQLGCCEFAMRGADSGEQRRWRTAKNRYERALRRALPRAG